MKKILITVVLIAAATGAHAANTLSLSACSANSATATWNVDSGAASSWIEARGVADNTSLHIQALDANSGSLALDWASFVDDTSNASLTLILNDGSTTVSASCP